MFLARYNIEVVNGKAHRINYDINRLDNNTDEQLQNLLLDMYFSVLSSMEHRIDTTTPLDVTTQPLVRVKNEIETAKGIATDNRDSKAGWWLNPLFQAEQRAKNAGSSLGIGPMALNNVFRFFLQMSGLDMYQNKYFNELGLSLRDGDSYRIYDKYGESILDATSALINAFVDAVKDNYIGRMNVNVYTFDVTSMLISNGFGEATYYFLGQQGIVDLANEYMNVKQGNIVANEDDKRGNTFLENVLDSYRNHITDSDILASSHEHASVDEISKEFMKDNLPNKNTQEWYALQCRYIQSFLEMKQVGEEYRKSLTVAQIDTGKYGISASDVINFMQTYNVFNSEYNIAFKNPNDLFTNTFLGVKYEYGVKALFDMFQNAILEFSSGYVRTLNNIAMAYGIYGPYGKLQLKRINQRLRTTLLGNFFIGYVAENTKNYNNPLYDILAGENTVVDRYSRIKEIASYSDEGKALFDVLRPTLKKTGSPKFFNIDSSVIDNPAIKSNVTQAWKELYDSSNSELSKFAKDLAVYMFFVSGGSDNNAGGLTKTTIFDLIPPTLLSNISVNGMTYNKYVSDILEGLSAGHNITDNTVDVALQLNAMFDDNFATRVNRKDFMVKQVFNNQAVIIGKGSDNLLNYNTGTYKEFIKIYDQSGIPQLYKLGNVVMQEYKGKKYLNPVYFKSNAIGYRQLRNNAYSIRTDGYVDSNGVVKSLLWNNTESAQNAKQLQGLNKAQQKIADDMIPFGRSVDFASIWDKFGQHLPDYNGFGIPYSSYAAVDAADIVLYISESGNTTRNIVDYARFKNKDFRVIDADSKLGYNGKNVFIIGDASFGTVKKITDKLKDATVLISTENNTIGDTLLIVNKTTPFVNYEYNRLPQQIQTANDELNAVISDFVLHSGGALGADTIWGNVAKEYGMQVNHYYSGTKTPNGNKQISPAEKAEGQKKATIAAIQMGRIESGQQIRDNLIIRDWVQVKHADAIFAVTSMLQPGDSMNYGKTAKIQQGKGGTGYTIQMAINENKPVYVYDQSVKKWYKNIDGKWSESEIPTLTKNFAGIGTREINKSGIQAIRNVFNKTFGSQAIISNLTANGNKRMEECK